MSVVEFTAEALLGTPGEAMVSEATLRLIRSGIGSGVPVGTPLRRGIMLRSSGWQIDSAELGERV